MHFVMQMQFEWSIRLAAAYNSVDLIQSKLFSLNEIAQVLFNLFNLGFFWGYSNFK